MKTGFLAVLALWVLSLAADAVEKNYVYKGVYTSTDLVTRKVTALNLYLVFGEETLITSASSNYSHVSAVAVVFGGPLGKQRYSSTTFGKFRTLEVKSTIKGKEVVSELFTKGSSSDVASGDGAHHADTLVLEGRHSSSLYETPLLLKGRGVSSFGSLNPDGISSGAASISSLRLTLVRALTDPIPTGESLIDSVKRVEDFLKARGFIEFLP